MNWTRRAFLTNGLRAGALLPTLSSASLARALGAPRRRDERVLVVLQLTGGNDGLNTVVPHRQDAYFRSRPTLAQKPGALHALDDAHGLHPAMGALARQYAEGRVAIVQGVGSSHPDRSHFRSLEVWHSARPTGPIGETGWLGRLADQIGGDDALAMPALSLDDGDLPLCLRARRLIVPTVRDPSGYRLEGESQRLAERQRSLCGTPGSGDLGFLREAALSAFDAADRMRAVRDAAREREYPANMFARKLRLVADLVQGGFGTRLFHLSLTGFDTHSRQARVHQALLARLSNALAAFQQDLAAGGYDREVTTFVFSEFGRRARENGSQGTDHGRGAPVFVVGGAVRGGLHGVAPDLDALVEGDLPAAIDFRSIYASLERDWLGLEPGSDVEPLSGLFA